MEQLKKRRVFELGQILATPGALAALQKAGQDPHDFLARHVACDWGDLSDDIERTRVTSCGLSLRQTALRRPCFCPKSIKRNA